MPDAATELDQSSPPPVDQPRERSKLHRKLHANPVTSLTTKIVVGVVGAAVALVGVVMIVTPGPAFVLIPLGLAILATEFTFARKWLDWARDKATEAKRKSDEMDPAVRRRRLVLTGVAVLLVVGGVAWYVVVYDWPTFAVDGWDWVQSLAGWVPDLPAM